MEIVGGLIEPTSGEISIAGDPVAGTDPRSDRLPAGVDVPVAHGRRERRVRARDDGVGADERRKRAQAMIELVGLKGFEEHYPPSSAAACATRRDRAHARPGTEADPDGRALRRARRADPLDPRRGAVADREATGATVLFIAHSFDEALLLSDRIVVMTARPGRVKRSSEPLPRPRDSTIVSDPEFGRSSESCGRASAKNRFWPCDEVRAVRWEWSFSRSS